MWWRATVAIMLCRAPLLATYLTAVHQGVGYGELVDILQLIAKAYASCYGGDPNIGEHLQTVGEVEERGLTLDRCRYGDDDLLDLSREELVAE